MTESNDPFALPADMDPRALPDAVQAGTPTIADRFDALVSEMDVKVIAWLSDVDQGADEAEDICRLWIEIRKITQGRDIREVQP